MWSRSSAVDTKMNPVDDVRDSAGYISLKNPMDLTYNTCLFITL